MEKIIRELIEFYYSNNLPVHINRCTKGKYSDGFIEKINDDHILIWNSIDKCEIPILFCDIFSIDKNKETTRKYERRTK
jgi:hypothetical protein